RAVRGGAAGRGQPGPDVLAGDAPAAAVHHRHVEHADHRRVADLLRHHLHHDERRPRLHHARALTRHVPGGVPAERVRLRQRAGRGHRRVRRGPRAGPGQVQRLRLHGQPAGRSGVSGTATARPVRSASQPARGTAPPPRRRRRLSVGRVVAFVLATAWLVVVIAPIYYMVLASFRSQGNYLTENPWLPSGGLTVSEYGTVFGAGLGRYLLNSAILTAVCIVLTLTICLGAAFRIVRRSTRAASASFRVLLLGLAIPIQAIIVPLYLLVYKLHLYDTLFALMLTMSAAAVPLTVLVMVSFVRDIPRELIGAMLVDGGTEWTVFRRLIVPLVILFVVMRRQVMRSLGSVVMR